MSLYEKSVKAVHIITQLLVLVYVIQVHNKIVATDTTDPAWVITVGILLLYAILASALRELALWSVKSHAPKPVVNSLIGWQAVLPRELPNINGFVFYEPVSPGVQRAPVDDWYRERKVQYMRIDGFSVFLNTLGTYGTSRIVSTDLPHDLFVYSCSYETNLYARGTQFVLLVGSETFRAIPPGQSIPYMNPTFRTVQKEEVY